MNTIDNTICMYCESDKRTDHISWDEYFMGVAKLSSLRSKDPSTQVGACIVDPTSKKILSIGYNGFPRGCDDNIFPWGKTDADQLNNKYLYVVHSEANAILNTNNTTIHGCTMYVTLFPCSDCTKLIIQAGITEIIYMDDYNNNVSKYAANWMLTSAGITVRKYVKTNRTVTLSL